MTVLKLITHSNLFYLFSCAGFPCPQLDVPRYQFIATCNQNKKEKEGEHGHKHKQGCKITWQEINICASLTLNRTQGGAVVMPWMCVKGTTAWPFPELLRPRANTRLSQVTGHNNTSVSYWRLYSNISFLIYDKSETKKADFLVLPPKFVLLLTSHLSIVCSCGPAA